MIWESSISTKKNFQKANCSDRIIEKNADFGNKKQ